MLQVFAKWMVGIILVTNCWTVFDKNDELTVMEDVTIFWGSISLLFLFFSICGLSMGIHYRRCISCRKVAPKDFFLACSQTVSIKQSTIRLWHG
ncbi:MAG: hypothetical protein ACKO4R_03025, partial [Synechococcales cyanobacterium]